MLIIGRRKPVRGDDFGGVVVLYELFLEFLHNKNIEHEDIDLNWRNYPNKFVFLLLIYFLLAKSILSSKHQKISFHGTSTDFTYYAPVIVFFAYLSGKRITLRPFGGNFDVFYDDLDSLRKALVSFSLKNANCVFFETKYLIQKFSDISSRVWFPNVRKINTSNIIDSDYHKRFVFISHIKETKGVTVILEAIRQLPDDYTFHLYGPIQDYSPPSDLNKIFTQSYKGILDPDEVLLKMRQYDVLLLPTFHGGEGYPGAIIEAYSQGLPVISTKWRSIPEIVENEKTGFLIEPKSVEGLIEAIKKINKHNYPRFSSQAFSYSKNFSQEIVMKRILKKM